MDLKEAQKKFERVKLKHFTDGAIRGTIAVIFDGELRHVGLATCSPEDNFSRSKGRLIAIGRAVRSYELEHGLHTNNPRPGDIAEINRFSFNINEIPEDVKEMLPKHLYTTK